MSVKSMLRKLKTIVQNNKKKVKRINQMRSIYQHVVWYCS